MELLERNAFLDELDGLYRQALQGHGRMLLLGGEAGVGKTSLVREFARRVQPQETVLTAACEPTFAPCPHSLVADMDELTGGKIGTLVDRAAPPLEIARVLLSVLENSPPVVVIIEDAHWIYEAAVDGLRYLGRRIASVSTLLIVTFRDDEIGKNHPLCRLLGDLATAPAVSRMHIPPLSLAGVTALTGDTEFDPVELFELTGGNPFFVTEVIASGATGMPATVRDAVLARADRLSPDARAFLEAAAITGSPAESWLVPAVSQTPPRAADECIGSGLLRADGSSLVFRHELARNAILEEIAAPQQIELHRRVLAELRRSGYQEVVRLAHHAASSFDREAVLEYCPAAAQRAAGFQSHREAATQYERVLTLANGLTPARRAELLMAWSTELSLIDRNAAAIETCLQALELFRAEENRLREGDALRWLARLYWYAGRNDEANLTLVEAQQILEKLPPSRELAMVYSSRAQLNMLAWDTEPAIEWGEKAMCLAEQLDETETLVHALNNVGSALYLTGDLDRAETLLRRSLQMALQANLADHASRVYTQMAARYCQMYRFLDAGPLLSEGIAYTGDHDLDYRHYYLLALRGMSQFFLGQWDAAIAQEIEVLRRPELASVTRMVASTVLGQARSRQGEPEASDLLDEALDIASRAGELQRIGPVRIARAEHAWLAGDLDRARDEASAISEQALRSGHRWLIGECVFWLWRAGAVTTAPEQAFEPYALQIEGKWREAAAAWRALGCPYEAAWALADSELESELRFAHAEFMRLGAAPAAAVAAHRLRELGVERIPRGPRAATQANPFQLTGRELEVLALLAQRKRTEDIAETLFLSHRTVSHHISAILAKLEVSTRHEAAWKAIQLGIVSQSGYSHLTK